MTRAGAPTQTRLAHAAAVALLAAFAGLLLLSMPYESPTIDEPLHYVRGAAFWWTGDTRLSYAHPPLANALGALPNRDHPLLDLTKPRRPWERAEYNTLAASLVAADYGAFRHQLFQARTVLIALAVLFGLYLYHWCRGRFGSGPALFALLLYVIHPTLIAHARLMTTDMPVTIASFVTLGELVRYRERRRLVSLVTAGLALGAAMAVKFSGVYLVPLVGGVLLIDALVARDRPLSRRLLSLGARAAVAGVLALLVVDAAYRFQRTNETVAQLIAEPRPSPPWDPLHLRNDPMGSSSPLARLPSWLPIPLPSTYVYGLFTVGQMVQDGRRTYFMGRPSMGSPAYFPVLLVLKQPLVLLFLLALAARRLRTIGALSPAAKVLGAAAALYLIMAMTSHLNLGVRHVLPMMPLLVVLAGLEASSVLRARATHPWRFRVAVALGVASTVGTLAAFPHYIGYFNALAINETIFSRISIVGEDWGQDVQDTARYLEREHLTPVSYSPQTPASAYEMESFGVESTPLECDSPPDHATWVVLHAAVVARTRCFAWLGLPDRRPDARINAHMNVYRFDPASPR